MSGNLLLALAPTYLLFPVIDYPYLDERGPDAVKRYRVLNSFRPWWASLSYVSPEQRPVDLARTAIALSVVGLLGYASMVLGSVRLECNRG